MKKYLLILLFPVLLSAQEILPNGWFLQGSNGANEMYKSVPANILQGKTTLTVQYNLKGLCILGGDASALIFDQNGWKMASLLGRGINCHNGIQTAVIPLSDFGVNTNQPLTGSFHTRFWHSSNWNVDILSAVLDEGTVTPPAGNPKIHTIVDKFDGGRIDTTKWEKYTDKGGVILQGNQLNYGLATNLGSWSGIHTKTTYDLTGSSATIEFVSAKGGATWLDLNLSVEQMPIVDNFLAIGINTKTQELEAVRNINADDVVIAKTNWNPVTMRFGRIRETSGTIYFEYSQDGVTWNVLHSANTATFGVPINSLFIVLDDYAFEAGTPDTHILDNLNYIPNSCDL